MAICSFDYSSPVHFQTRLVPSLVNIKESSSEQAGDGVVEMKGEGSVQFVLDRALSLITASYAACYHEELNHRHFLLVDDVDTARRHFHHHFASGFHQYAFHNLTAGAVDNHRCVVV